jgi:hypothetical protein
MPLGQVTGFYFDLILPGTPPPTDTVPPTVPTGSSIVFLTGDVIPPTVPTGSSITFLTGDVIPPSVPTGSSITFLPPAVPSRFLYNGDNYTIDGDTYLY